MRLRPCIRCPHRADCDLRDAMRAGLLAADVPASGGRRMRPTSVMFSCAKRLSLLPVGRRVTVHLRQTLEVGEPCYWTGEPNLAERPLVISGTVVEHWRGGKLRVWLDEPTNHGKWLVRLHPDLVRPIESEPELVDVCSDCCSIVGRRRPSFYCEKCPERAKEATG